MQSRISHYLLLKGFTAITRRSTIRGVFEVWRREDGCDEAVRVSSLSILACDYVLTCWCSCFVGHGFSNRAFFSLGMFVPCLFDSHYQLGCLEDGGMVGEHALYYSMPWWVLYDEHSLIFMTHFTRVRAFMTSLRKFFLIFLLLTVF